MVYFILIQDLGLQSFYMFHKKDAIAYMDSCESSMQEKKQSDLDLQCLICIFAQKLKHAPYN